MCVSVSFKDFGKPRFHVSPRNAMLGNLHFTSFTCTGPARLLGFLLGFLLGLFGFLSSSLIYIMRENFGNFGFRRCFKGHFEALEGPPTGRSTPHRGSRAPLKSLTHVVCQSRITVVSRRSTPYVALKETLNCTFV